jgi:hypothetical protein
MNPTKPTHSIEILPPSIGRAKDSIATHLGMPKDFGNHSLLSLSFGNLGGLVNFDLRSGKKVLTISDLANVKSMYSPSSENYLCVLTA